MGNSTTAANTVSNRYCAATRTRRRRRKRPTSSALIRHPPLEEADLRQGEQHRDQEERNREHGRLTRVTAIGQRLVDEIGEHVRLLERPALGEEVDLAERLEGEDGADHHREEDGG